MPCKIGKKSAQSKHKHDSKMCFTLNQHHLAYINIKIAKKGFFYSIKQSNINTPFIIRKKKLRHLNHAFLPLNI